MICLTAFGDRPSCMAPARTIWLETHATSLDNEAGLASGRFNVDLSATGVEQALALGRRYTFTTFERVLTSDLLRAWRTAVLAFGDGPHIHRDARLGECDYGRLTRTTADVIGAMRLSAVDRPFPGGESYRMCTERVRQCLVEHLDASTRDLLVIGHRATYYALEHLFNAVPLESLITAPWMWQPGWRYELSGEVVDRIRLR